MNPLGPFIADHSGKSNLTTLPKRSGIRFELIGYAGGKLISIGYHVVTFPSRGKLHLEIALVPLPKLKICVWNGAFLGESPKPRLQEEANTLPKSSAVALEITPFTY